MKGDLLERVETLAAIAATGTRGGMFLPPGDMASLHRALTDTAAELRALRDAAMVMVMEIEDNYGGTQLSLGRWNDAVVQHLAGRRVRLVPVGDGGSV